MAVSNEAFQVTADKKAEMRAVLEAYEKWEADLIEDNRAWADGENIIIPPSLWERMIEIQAMRNKALGRNF